MKKIPVTIKRKSESYKILIGSGLITKLPGLFDFSEYSSVAIITDSNVGPKYVQSIKRLYIRNNVSVFTFPAGEQHKNLDTVTKAYQFLARHQVDRKGLIINLGGGIVTDLGGFVAATYMRGVDTINIPTTVEGMVDASIGGKVGVNLGHWKNYVGMFHQPKAIVMDIDTLKTLNERNLVAGFGEIIKHGLIADKQYFEFVTSKKPKDFSQTELTEIISRSCEIKKNIVEQDERESERRKLLNFGHTIGHAVESLSLKTKRPLLHGEAVAIGMIAESMICQLAGMISSKALQLIIVSIRHAGLPVKIPFRVKRDFLLDLIKKDKKNVSGQIQWTLLNTIGYGIINQKISKNIVKKALAYISN